MRLLSAVRTQWRTGFGGPVGLDYPAVFATARVLGVDMTPHVLRRLAMLEADALRRFASRPDFEKGRTRA